MPPDPAKPRQARGKSHPSLQCHNWPDWVADGAVWSYPVSAKGGPAFGGNPQTEKPVEIQEVSSFSHLVTFLTRTRGSSSFAIRLFSALSGFNHECQRRSIRFPYSELTAFCHVLVPARLIGRVVVRAGIEVASIKFSIRQSQPPGRLKEGRVVNPPEAAPTVTHCRKGLYVSSANVRRREHLSGYRSREARVELPILGWKRSKREQTRPLAGASAIKCW